MVAAAACDRGQQAQLQAATPTTAPLKCPLPAAFFDRPADQVARDLPGQMLVRRIGPHWRSLMVTETEADIGPQDLASHAARVRVLQRAWPTRALLVAAEASLCLGM